MKIAFHTLGCKVNQYESQAMAQRFLRLGYDLVDFHERADVYVINTCTVTETGDKKSRQMISRAHRQNPDAVVAVVGCYAQRAAKLLAGLPGVSVVIGSFAKHRLPEAVALALGGERVCWVADPPEGYEPLALDETQIAKGMHRTRAHLKIQYGCDMFCSYCAIPYARGRGRSRPMREVAREAERLGAAGYAELVVTGIHLSSYGKDLQGGAGLAQALRTICASGGAQVRRVRIGSLEPRVVTPEFLQTVAELPAICRQFHLALQSGSDNTLRRMRRRYTAEEFLDAAQALQSAFPDCAITTDVLCGFPGETDADFARTLSVMRQVGFARVHAFPFSPREGTPAATMGEQVPKAVREARCKQAIECGGGLEKAFAQGMVGRAVEVLLEERVGGAWEGFTREYLRARVDAPEGAAGELFCGRAAQVRDGVLVCEG